MKKFLSLLLVAAMALSLLSVSALAEEPVKIDMFYQSSRPMNEFTELTRQKVIEDVGVDMNLIQGGDNWKQQAWRCTLPVAMCRIWWPLWMPARSRAMPRKARSMTLRI